MKPDKSLLWYIGYLEGRNLLIGDATLAEMAEFLKDLESLITTGYSHLSYNYVKGVSTPGPSA